MRAALRGPAAVSLFFLLTACPPSPTTPDAGAPDVQGFGGLGLRGPTADAGDAAPPDVQGYGGLGLRGSGKDAGAGASQDGTPR
jgi:hypothetical protein